MRCTHRKSSRLTALLAATLLGLCANAGQAVQLSPSVVLVLKLVTADRVQPVTGVVVSDDGLVLVPAEFVAEQAEIIVLDGGTDIIAHGRHAEVVARDPESGLALLAADGLARPGITLSDSAPGMGRELILQAYPPAKSIAAGEGPLSVPATLADSGLANADTGASLPNVTGALLNGCGHLAAYRVADGAQSLAPASAATLVGVESLAAVIGEANPEVQRAGCTPPTETAQAQAGAEQLPEDDQANTAEPVQSSVETALRTLPSPVARSAPVTIEPAGDMALPGTPDEQSVELPAPTKPDAAPPWLLPAVALVLVLLAWRYAVANRNRRNARNGPVQPAADEPDTVRLAAAKDDAAPVMRSGRGNAEGLPDSNALPEGCNGLVVLENPKDTEPEPMAFCAVDLEDFEVVAGRGGADLDVAHPAVSRRHARIKGRNGTLTIEDLGSTNGTYVERAPCLPGEVIYLEAGTEIWLGEFHCRIGLRDEEQLKP